MPNHRQIGAATVEWLGLNQDGESVSRPVQELVCMASEGLKGDRHFGATRLSDVREDTLIEIGVGKEVPIANMRQFSAVSVEELIAIWAGMGIRNLTINEYGLLAENMVLSGFRQGLSELPFGSFLTFSCKKGNNIVPRKVVLAVWGENNPCIIPHKNIQWHYPEMRFVKPFAVAGRGLRGIVGFVYCSGKIKVGDSVSIWVPSNHPDSTLSA